MTTSRGATGALAAASAAALVVALLNPTTTVVVGTILLGVLALALGLRYVVARVPAVAGRDVVGALGLLLAVGTALHLLGPVAGVPARVGESLAGLAVVGVVAWRALAGRRRTVALAAVAVAAVASSVWPAWATVALLHLHQLVVLVFLWDWSTRLAPRARAVFRAVQAGWAVGVPVVVLSGLLDRWLTSDPGVARSVVGDGHALLAASAVPGHSAGTTAVRLLTVLAVLQTMQLLVWVAFLPHFAPEQTVAFETRYPALTGARVWASGFVAAAVTAVVFATGWARGQLFVGALWSWAGHVELAAALLVVAGAARTADAWAPGAGTADAQRADAQALEAPVAGPVSPAGTAVPAVVVTDAWADEPVLGLGPVAPGWAD